ncbi:hypothetical protein NQ318_017430 [Aromia moschata]|uniref:Uncharacterized protein n=1 Tax=Aromia moschata TaxID=1265417 RepID=A0AAV8Z4Q2_9CUCU|nr:hypothetical protein NQ318_017430 [Aromia moschata]
MGNTVLQRLLMEWTLAENPKVQINSTKLRLSEKYLKKISVKEVKTAASEAYFNRYPERRQPNMSIFGRLKENLVEYGGFNKPRPKNYRIQDAEDVAINVVGMVVVNPSISSRQIEAESGNNNSSFQLILNADWISAIGTYNKLSKTNYFLKISFGQMKVTDALSHAARHLPEPRQLELLQNLTDLLRKTFSSQFVFPALGHDDPVLRRKELGRMWSRWLPTDSMKTFDTGTCLGCLLQGEAFSLDIQDNPHKPTRQVAADNDDSKTSILRLLKNEKYRPYKIHLVQELNGDDPDRRLEFCEIMANRCQDNPLFIKNIIFSSFQITFVLNGTVNKQNCRYWRTDPHKSTLDDGGLDDWRPILNILRRFNNIEVRGLRVMKAYKTSHALMLL